METPILTLLTDFGLTDPYVGAMKGVVLRLAPAGTQMVDLTHEIPAHDVWTGAYTLAAAAPWYPEGTVHVAVVDPGVGSDRRAVVARTGRHLYVAPDNGLLTAIFDREQLEAVYSIDDRSLGLAPMHPTFHGRDLFAPVGARLAGGLDPALCGAPLEDPVRLYRDPPARREDGTIAATVLHVDRFGNVTTDVTPARLRTWYPETPEPAFALEESGDVLPWHASYAFARKGRLFVLWGSSGYLEIALNQDSAARALNVGAGSRLRFNPAD
jgi:hypothetical protein